MSDLTNNAASSDVSTGTSEASGYFDLHVDGVGYLNRIREVKVKRGQFWACSISALRGDATDVDYTKFDLRVSGKFFPILLQSILQRVEVRTGIFAASIITSSVASGRP